MWVQVKKGIGAGLWVKVNPRTGAHIVEGSSELPVQKAFQEHLRPGMVFYDLGANIGFFSLLGARLVGSVGKVFSFEADPDVAMRLRANTLRNNFAHITVVENAVWSYSGPVNFIRADATQSPDRGLGFVTSAPDRDTVQIAGVSLDDYTRRFPPPDFIKCDVEGAEVEVMRGARQLLRTKRPIVLCEIHSEENRQALLKEFDHAGYECKPCDDIHLLASPR